MKIIIIIFAVDNEEMFIADDDELNQGQGSSSSAFNCHLCAVDEANLEQLTCHMTSHIRFNCTKCDFKTNNSVSWGRHLIQHDNELLKEEDQYVFSIKAQGRSSPVHNLRKTNMFFYDSETCQLDEMANKSENPVHRLSCQGCQYVSVSMFDMKRHMQISQHGIYAETTRVVPRVFEDNVVVTEMKNKCGDKRSSSIDDACEFRMLHELGHKRKHF